jgi:flap endonuclease-1
MGIHGLSKVIADQAPRALKEHSLQQLFNRKIAIDASTSIYQFLIAVRADTMGGSQLTNAAGETTSHLMGMFYRTIRLVEAGIKPIYVFDGKAPGAKARELAKRGEKRQEATDGLAEAKETGNEEAALKFAKRTVRVTRQHNEDCKKLLSFMGVPWIQAPGEAEAQCAEIVKGGLAYAVGSEDLDTLTFAAPILMRHLTFSEARKLPIAEFTLSEVLEGMKLSMEEFIDLCILLGCDYCDSIKGIGPKKALDLIREHKNIETIIANIDTEKYKVPENWEFAEARELFKRPNVVAASDEELVKAIRWDQPDVEGLVSFMVNDNGFK